MRNEENMEKAMVVFIENEDNNHILEIWKKSRDEGSNQSKYDKQENDMERDKGHEIFVIENGKNGKSWGLDQL